MRITDLPNRWVYPRKFRSQLITKHMAIIAYSQTVYDGTSSMKRNILHALNVVSYMICNGENFPDTWNEDNPIDTLPAISSKQLKEYLQELYIDYQDVQWDIEIPQTLESDDRVEDTPKVVSTLQKSEDSNEISSNPEDLYVTGPKVPRFDNTRKFISKNIEGTEYVIYKTLPEIPTRQCEISVTTDISLLSDSDFMKLYPKNIFYTRPSEMYQKFNDVTYDPILGSIFPILKFSESDLRDNVVKYPHLENIVRVGYSKGDRVLVEFGKYIEIDGKLYKTKDIWKDLPDTKSLPKSKSVMHEYVIRRYLLERDILGIDHRYKMFGDLDPFLTLFLPEATYRTFGYSDTLSIAKQCVSSRIAYLRSRNPVLRRVSEYD